MHQRDKIMNIILIRWLILLVFNYYAGKLPATFPDSMTGVSETVIGDPRFHDTNDRRVRL